MICIIIYYHMAGMLLSLTAAAPTAAQFRWPITIIISSSTPPLDQSETVFTVTSDPSSHPSTISAVFRRRWSTVRLRATGTRHTNRWRSTNRWERWYFILQSRKHIIIIILLSTSTRYFTILHNAYHRIVWTCAKRWCE